MRKDELHTFTYIANFRGGTYCTQVNAKDIGSSTVAWVEKLKTEKKEIQYLGDNTIKELQTALEDNDSKPILLAGLKNVWCLHYMTKQGSFLGNVIKTQADK